MLIYLSEETKPLPKQHSHASTSQSQWAASIERNGYWKAVMHDATANFSPLSISRYKSKYSTMKKDESRDCRAGDPVDIWESALDRQAFSSPIGVWFLYILSLAASDRTTDFVTIQNYLLDISTILRYCVGVDYNIYIQLILSTENGTSVLSLSNDANAENPSKIILRPRAIAGSPWLIVKRGEETPVNNIALYRTSNSLMMMPPRSRECGPNRCITGL
jgi:hypothetical protein